MYLTRREILALLAAGVASPRGAGAATPAGQWRKLRTESYKGKQDDIAFTDADHGWYGNGQGKLYRTEDGGDNWTLLWQQPGTFIRALGFADRLDGWLGNVGTGYYPGVTDPQPLYRTRDGGLTWQPVLVEGIQRVKGICGIDVLAVQRRVRGVPRTEHIVTAAGRVGGPAMMLRSEDSGENWRVIDLGAHAGMILDVKFHDPEVGFVCASGSAPDGEGDALMLMTRDGGVNWRPVWRSNRRLENCWKMSWPSRRVGYATVQSYNDQVGDRRVIVTTDDGGAHWREVLLANAHGLQQFGIGFLDEQMGWVGTSLGGLVTTDGGRHWNSVEMGKFVNKIRVIGSGSAKRAIAIGTDVYRWEQR